MPKTRLPPIGSYIELLSLFNGTWFLCQMPVDGHGRCCGRKGFFIDKCFYFLKDKEKYWRFPQPQSLLKEKSND